MSDWKGNSSGNAEFWWALGTSKVTRFIRKLWVLAGRDAVNKKGSNWQEGGIRREITESYPWRNFPDWMWVLRGWGEFEVCSLRKSEEIIPKPKSSCLGRELSPTTLPLCNSLMQYIEWSMIHSHLHWVVTHRHVSYIQNAIVVFFFVVKNILNQRSFHCRISKK